MKMTKTIFKSKTQFFLSMFFMLSLSQAEQSIAEGVGKLSLESASWTLSAENWEVGQDGNKVLQIPELKAFMQNWIRQYEANNVLRIELQYPGGEEGELWVQELSDWLVSMGLPSKNILMVPGSGTADKIKLTFVH